MSIIRRLILAALVALSAVPAFGQTAPPPVPALPDTDRVQSYSISSTTCACAVNFALYGDSNDYWNWLTVYINGVQVAYNDSTYGWTITSPTGSLNLIPRPITDAILTFNSAQTGTITIVGDRRPRRLSQFTENRGVAARDLNQIITDLVAQNRETWYLFERTSVYEPGFFPNALPLAANRASKFACWDSNGQPTTCTATTGSTTFSAGTGIQLTGVSPTQINTNLSAGNGIALSGTNPQVISRTNLTTNPQTGDYTASSSDCGKIVLSTGGLKTLTLPAASSVGNGCEIGFRNNEVYSGIATGRGKKLSGFPSDFASNNILYPGQTGKVVSNGTNWYTSTNPGRWFLPQSVEFCVRQDGSSTSDGFGDGTVAADCLNGGQAAVLAIGTRIDGTGYAACNVSFYAGGTNILTEQVSMTGQSMGCYLTFNWRGATTHTYTAACFTGGDNGIAIYNWNLGFTPTFKCNTSNAVSICAFYGHQTVIYDFFGTAQWVPGGNNDCFLFLDAQGRAVASWSGGGLIIGDGAARSMRSVFWCDAHCAGFQTSGPIGFSANVTCTRVFETYGGGWINTTSTFTGTCTGVSASISSGYSDLITNGTTIPGGTITTGTGGPGQVCLTKC